MMTVRPVILCGGSGTRLWPLSRGRYPKQFMDLGGESLFGRTLERVKALAGMGRPLVVCNEEHRFFAAAIAQEHGLKSEILLEPQGRNTAPAIALAALAALEDDPAAVLLVLPSDHQIHPVELFDAAVKEALEALEADGRRLMTFGAPATRPETGYGYLVAGEALPGGGRAVARFVEKPDAAGAAALIEAGHCAWNCGIFLFSAAAYLEALDMFAPKIGETCRRAWQGRQQDADFVRPDAELFLSSPSDSIDYAVMERAARVGMVDLRADWSDLGSWEAFYEAAPHDGQGNALQGDVVLRDVSGSYLHASHRLVAALGVRDLAVVETADAVLVVDRARTQEVRGLLEELRASGRSEAETQTRVFRPWGFYEVVSVSQRYQVKKITVRPGAALSLQLHYHRAEHWVVVAGTARVTLGEESRLLTEDESVYIPLGTKHRLENPGRCDLELIEVQSGSYLGEDDIVRFEDVYGRL